MNSFFTKTTVVTTLLVTLVSFLLNLLQFFNTIPSSDPLKSVYITGIIGVILGALSVLGNNLFKVITDDRQEYTKRKYDGLMALGEAVQNYRERGDEESVRAAIAVYNKYSVLFSGKLCGLMTTAKEKKRFDDEAVLQEIRHVIGLDGKVKIRELVP